MRTYTTLIFYEWILYKYPGNIAVFDRLIFFFIKTNAKENLCISIAGFIEIYSYNE